MKIFLQIYLTFSIFYHNAVKAVVYNPASNLLQGVENDKLH
ncbi:hypothetical protein HC081234_02480 [Helicobacter cinaedi]|nr:hypothetical protein HC081234_02480 [Helicobacter cinaedi]